MVVALHELGLEDLVLVVTHPAQLAYIEDITELLTGLRKCREPADYNDFQREALFPALYRAERHRSIVRRCLSRVRAGKTLPGEVPQLPEGDDPRSPDTWRIEDVVWTRVCRQLRAVGDALAWRASGFNRLLFVIGSSNQPSGPMADKEGLLWEIGVLEETYARSANFVLLNDLTSCMRIGDLTELPVGGRPWLYEVKKNPANTRSAQSRRMKEAVAAAMERGPLPGQPGSALIEASRPCETHLQMLCDAAVLAAERGVVGMRVPGGRALVAVSLEKTLAEQAWGRWFEKYESERRGVLRRANLTGGPENISLRNAEVAGGSAPRTAPFGCYPMSPRNCALMICDFLAFEVIFDPAALLGTFARHGIDAELTFNPLSPRVGQQELVYALARGGRRLDVRLGGLNEYLLELLTAESFVSSMVDLLDNARPTAHPVIVYENRRDVWT